MSTAVTPLHELGFRTVTIKLCENCARTFFRPPCFCNKREHRCSCRKYCHACVQSCLMPPTFGEKFNQELVSVVPKLSKHLIHYDRPKRRPCSDYGDWKGRISAAFAERGELTAREMQEVIGCYGGPTKAYQMVHQAGFPIRLARFLGNSGVYVITPEVVH